MKVSWQSVVAARVGITSGQARWTELRASSFGATWRLEHRGERYFVKSHPATRQATLQAEADGLSELAAAHAIRVPAPVVCDLADDVSFLVLDWLELSDLGRDSTLGAALAQLHRTTAARFGWHRDNTIGATPQHNGWLGDWAVFFRDRRIAPQLEHVANGRRGRALEATGDRLLEAIPQLLEGHAPAASLLHGDLWSGNAARLSSGEPVIFDPAVYFGDRETDLAMTELFGGFGADFYAAYRAAWPVDSAYPVRRMLYNLYHVLNHFNLFGGAYGDQALTMMTRLLAEVR